MSSTKAGNGQPNSFAPVPHVKFSEIAKAIDEIVVRRLGELRKIDDERYQFAATRLDGISKRVEKEFEHLSRIAISEARLLLHGDGQVGGLESEIKLCTSALDTLTAVRRGQAEQLTCLLPDLQMLSDSLRQSVDRIRRAMLFALILLV